MRAAMVAAIAAFALSACETTGGYGVGGGATQLSQCMRNALIGAGVGAVVGGVTAPEGNRGENAAIGAAVGGLGAYAVCRILDGQSQARIERNYLQALNMDAPVADTWASATGEARTLQVNRPEAAGSGCRRLSASLSAGAGAPQPLPPETYCRGASGAWVPTG